MAIRCADGRESSWSTRRREFITTLSTGQARAALRTEHRHTSVDFSALATATRTPANGRGKQDNGNDGSNADQALKPCSTASDKQIEHHLGIAFTQIRKPAVAYCDTSYQQHETLRPVLTSTKKPSAPPSRPPETTGRTCSVGDLLKRCAIYVGSRGGHGSTLDSSPPPLKGWATQTDPSTPPLKRWATQTRTPYYARSPTTRAIV